MEMRRKDRLVSQEETADFLEKGEYGFLSMVTAENDPYTVPVNYVYYKDKNEIYIHCAGVGRKIDCLNANQSVQFSVVADTKPLDGEFTTLYFSAFAFGKASYLMDDEDKRTVLFDLCAKYFESTTKDSAGEQATRDYIEKFLPRTTLIKINVEEISGKANRKK